MELSIHAPTHPSHHDFVFFETSSLSRKISCDFIGSPLIPHHIPRNAQTPWPKKRTMPCRWGQVSQYFPQLRPLASALPWPLLAWFEHFAKFQWAQILDQMWGFPKMVLSQNGCFMRENPIKMDDDWGYAYFRKPPNKWGKQILIQCRLMWSSTGINSVPSQLLCLVFPMIFSTRRWDHGVYVMKNNKWFIKTMVEPLRLMISSNPCGFVWKLCTPLLVSHNLFPYFPY